MIDAARAVIDSADALLIGAGAGMGVDSGLPDFRGDEGFWRAYPPLKRLGISFHEMADPRWFKQDPTLAWGFYGHRLNLYRTTVPHPGFGMLRALARGRPLFVFTSNVDGQFQRAGFAGGQILEVHGSIHHLQCMRPCSEVIWAADGRSRRWTSGAGRVAVLEFGAGTAVPNLRLQRERVAAGAGTAIRVNPRESFGPPGTISPPLGALDACEALVG